MGKIIVEVCLISARGLRRASSLCKLQWFAVGWIDPSNKYCTKIATSRNSNPIWKTKFSELVECSGLSVTDLALHVELYSRDPIFLRESLQGTATVALKEFVDKYLKNSENPSSDEEVGSFQLRRRNSDKPRGFVDISIRISKEHGESTSSPGDEGGFKLMDNSGTNMASTGWLQNHQQTNSPYPHPFPLNYSISSTGGPTNPSTAGSSYPPLETPPHLQPRYSYQPARTTPPPPPPPSNVGYIPTFLPRPDHLPQSYANGSSSGVGPRRNNGSGFGLGLGAGELAAGAVIFGDDFMSGFDYPRGLEDASATRSTNSPL